MFRSKTLFVIGAGASGEFGLPTGHDLKSEISNLLRFSGYTGGDEECRRVISNLAYRDELNDPLKIARRMADNLDMAPSIDHYIGNYKNNLIVELAGKVAICKAILEAERRSKLNVSKNDAFVNDKFKETWFLEFWKYLLMGTDAAEIEKTLGDHTFIIFNYDRVVEWSLINAIAKYCGIKHQNAIDIVKNANIIHPYGSLGSIKEISFGSRNYDLLSMIKRIRTFSEAEADPEVVKKIGAALQSANQVLFLGCAFHEQNLQFFRNRAKGRPISIYGTSVGLSPLEVNAIKYNIEKIFDGHVTLEPVPCKEVFWHFGRALSA